MRRPQEDLACAETYTQIVDSAWTNACAQGIPFSMLDAAVNESLLHCADVHLKLAEFKIRHEINTRTAEHE